MHLKSFLRKLWKIRDKNFWGRYLKEKKGKMDLVKKATNFVKESLVLLHKFAKHRSWKPQCSYILWNWDMLYRKFNKKYSYGQLHTYTPPHIIFHTYILAQKHTQTHIQKHAHIGKQTLRFRMNCQRTGQCSLIFVWQD